MSDNEVIEYVPIPLSVAESVLDYFDHKHRRQRMVWLDLKKGDDALMVYDAGHRNERVHEVRVVSVGRKWITVEPGGKSKPGGERTKFQVERGYGEFGYSLHTKWSLAELRRRRDSIRTIQQVLHSNASDVPTDALVKAAELLRVSGKE